MAGTLKNEGHERIAQELAKGAGDFEAYRTAGYEGGKSTASEICNRDDVRARVAELLERGARRVEVTIADIVSQLDEDRTFAREKLAPAAAVTATMGKAKVLGLIVDRHAGPSGGAIPIRFDLSGLTDKELDELERLRSRIAIAGGDPGGEGQAGS